MRWQPTGPTRRRKVFFLAGTLYYCRHYLLALTQHRFRFERLNVERRTERKSERIRNYPSCERNRWSVAHQHLASYVWLSRWSFSFFAICIRLRTFKQLKINMTAIVDRIDAAADRIKDIELVADKKRVSFHHQPRRSHTPYSPSLLNLAGPVLLSSQPSRRHSQSRSHSHNVSVSVPFSVPFSSSCHNISLSSSRSSSTQFPLFHNRVQQQNANPITVAAPRCPSWRRSWALPYPPSPLPTARTT
jgi:hypothetical protein